MNNYVREFIINTEETFVLKSVEECREVLKINDSSINFKIIHCNIRSLNKNLDEFKILLAKLVLTVDCIVFSETWKLPNPNLYCIPGYTLYYNEGTYNQNDGLVIYVNNKLKSDYEIIQIGQFKFLTVYIKMPASNNNILISGCYRSPASNTMDFLKILQSYFEKLTTIKNSENCIFIGDLNIDILTRNSLEVVEYLNIMNENGFESMINKPTRVHNHHESCIDHIFYKSNDLNSHNIPLILENDITDHHVTTLQIIFNKQKQVMTENRYFTKINYDKLAEGTKRESWDTVFSQTNADAAMNNFISILNGNIHLATQEKRIKRKNTKIAPWITNGIIKSTFTKNKLFRDSLQHPNNPELRERFKIYRNILTTQINKAKYNYYTKKINCNAGNPQVLWGVINELRGKGRKRLDIDSIESKVGSTLTNPVEIASEFNEQFVGTGKTLAEKIVKLNKKTNNLFITKRISNSLFLLPTDEYEIQQTISTLKDKKSTGTDRIKAELLKHVRNHISAPLVHIFNLCIKQGVFPLALKNAIVVPIYKNGNKQQIENYRPISLTTHLSKLFEKLIKVRLISFLNKYKILSNRQYGFKEHTSTEDAVMYLLKNVYRSLEESNPCLCLFIDFKKAFDTVNHKLLLTTLENIGVRGSCLMLFESYLKERKQIVKINNVYSSELTVEYGVPQGTVLGPILFNIFINSIYDIPTTGDIIGFADDTVIFYKSDTWFSLKNNVEHDLPNIKSWLDNKLLTINFNKTQYLPFSCNITGLPTFNEIDVIMNDGKHHIIQSVSEYKYLGVYIDRHLKWDYHIDYVVRKMRSLLHQFHYLKTLVSKDLLKTIYHSLVESHIRYCVAAWGGAFYTHIHKLEITQKRFLRIILNKNFRYPSDQLYVEGNIYDPRQLYFLNVSLYFFKNRNSIVKRTHPYHTRHIVNYILPLCTKTITQRSLIFVGPKFFNFLPENIKTSTTTNIFKSRLKKFISEIPRIEIKNIVELNV